MKCYISRKLLYIIPLIAILFTWNCGGDEVRYRGALVGMWMTSRLPAVNGVDAESYLTRMNISPKDTSTFMGYRFMPDGTVLYYPFIQHDGTYIPGNCIEGSWLIKGRTLYMARKTYQLRPFYEIELIDSVLRFHQTKQMQLAYAQSLMGALHNPPPHASPLLSYFFLKKQMTATKKRPPREEDYDFHKPLFTAFSS